MSEKKKTLRQEVEDGLAVDGIYCLDSCMYKSFDFCILFSKKTGYSFKVDRAKRVKKCLQHFKGKVYQ